MNFSRCFASILVSLYKSINRTGILDYKWAQSLFVLTYFSYKKYLEDPYAKLIKNHPEIFCNGNILDIGANIGYTSYIFSNALTAPYQVFAFEPEKRNVDILKKVSNKYHFSDRLIITEAAVGNTEGEIEMWRNDGHHADHRVLTNAFREQLKGNIHIQKTSMITIDHFLKTKDVASLISFIKIDVQGYELAVCEGMKNTLLTNPNCIVGLEYCPGIMKALGYQANSLIQFFKERNYFFYRLNKNGTLDTLDVETDKSIKLGEHFQGYFDILCSQRALIKAS